MASVVSEKVAYTGASGLTLVGILTTPRSSIATTTSSSSSSSSSSPSSSCVLLLHGGMANKNSFYSPFLAERLAAELGLSTFRFDCTGCGESLPITSPEGAHPEEQSRNMMGGFWDDVADVGATIAFLSTERGLSVDTLVGHSRGGQVAHMYAMRHPSSSVRRVVGANMRFDLEYWRDTWATKGGDWTLAWKNRGKRVQHAVIKADVDTYAEVPMGDVAQLHHVDVLNIYGILSMGAAGGTGESQATYDVGDAALLTDGVVPFTDVEHTANLIPNHTVRFLPGVGHYYREEGSNDKLWVAVRDWLRGKEERGGREEGDIGGVGAIVGSNL